METRFDYVKVAYVMTESVGHILKHWFFEGTRLSCDLMI